MSASKSKEEYESCSSCGVNSWKEVHKEGCAVGQMTFDRKGKPIPMGEWARICSEEEREIGKAEMADGVVISTVYIGLDAQPAGVPPRIYETAVINPKKEKGNVLYTWRHTSAEDAIEAHKKVVKAWTKMFAEKAVLKKAEGESEAKDPQNQKK